MKGLQVNVKTSGGSGEKLEGIDFPLVLPESNLRACGGPVGKGDVRGGLTAPGLFFWFSWAGVCVWVCVWVCVCVPAWEAPGQMALASQGEQVLGGGGDTWLRADGLLSIPQSCFPGRRAQALV